MTAEDSYNLAAEQWDSIRSLRKVDHCIEEFAELLPKHARILDAGCGSGKPIAQYLLQHGFHVTEIDVSENMLVYARKYLPECTFLHSDFLNYESDQPYDAIIGFDSLWHIETKKQPLIYPKAASLLKTGGYFLFTAGLDGSDTSGRMFDLPFPYGSLTEEDLRKALADNGFTIISFQKHYQHPSSGTRDLLAVVRKTAQP